MANPNYKRIFAQQAGYKKRIKELFGNNVSDNSGIYILTRVDEEGFRYAYIGQARHILTRLAQHCLGYQAIDLSLKKHGWKSASNPYGWHMQWGEYPEQELDHLEQVYIKQYADDGYQLRNCTTGSQGQGKRSLENGRSNKKYGDGLIQGKKNFSKDLDHLLSLHLDVVPKRNPPTVNQQKALDKLQAMRDYYKEDKDES